MPTSNGQCADDSGRGHHWEKGISGSGHFGVVIQAQNLKSKKKVALKIIFIQSPSSSSSSDDDEELTNRVLEGRSKLQKIIHKNVVHCHDLWLSKLTSQQLTELGRLLPEAGINFPILSPNFCPIDDDEMRVIYIESELCTDNLRQYLRTSTESLFLRLEILFREIGSGLTFLHTQKMVHGSLTPENVLIHRYMEKGQRTSCVKLSDGGLFKIVGSTTTETIPPSPYKAPDNETARDHPSVDIFALGIILMELMDPKCNQDGDQFYQNSIQNLTQKRQFPPQFKSDQFLNELILDMTDKDFRRRPEVAKILEFFDTTLRRNLNGWVRYSPDMENLMEVGDIIEINRTTASHWGIYYGDGQLVHFHPIAVEEKGGGVVNLEKFVPGIVSLSNLKEVAGICLIRMNNRPDLRSQPRSLKSSLEVIHVLLNRPEFSWSLAYMNSEHFVTFVKFDGISQSTQVMTNLKIFGQIRMHKFKNCQIFNQLSMDQWRENMKIKMDKIFPNLKLLEEGILGGGKI